MPLQIGLKILQESLFASFSNNDNTAMDLATSISAAIMVYSYTGIVNTLVNTDPGAVSGFMTSGPIKGKSNGVFSEAGAGPMLGLSSSLDDQVEANLARKLELAMTTDNDRINSLISSYEYGSSSDYEYTEGIIEFSTPSPYIKELLFERDTKSWPSSMETLATNGPFKIATYVSLAIHDSWKNANFKTSETTTSPVSAPAPAGPIIPVGLIGTGGLGKDSQGIGWSAAKSILQNDLYTIFSDMSDTALEVRCDDIAKAIIKYFKEASITTTNIPIPISATIDVTSGSGSYMPGVLTGVGTFL